MINVNANDDDNGKAVVSEIIDMINKSGDVDVIGENGNVLAMSQKTFDKIFTDKKFERGNFYDANAANAFNKANIIISRNVVDDVVLRINNDEIGG